MQDTRTMLESHLDTIPMVRAMQVAVGDIAPAHLQLTAPLSVNLLSRHQQDVSAAFGGGVPQEERFRIGDWQEGTGGVPMLAGAQANLSCVIDAMLAYGTHSIVIARVLSAEVSDDVAPLIYQDGAYL